MSIRFGRALCADLASSERREWLVTNGIGGYASGTIAGLLTRRYHGLLIAATRPPVGRSLLIPKIDEKVGYGGASYALCVNRWADGTIDPDGHVNIESFHLDGTAPVWRFACADAIVEKRVWMTHGVNATSVRYLVERASAPVGLTVRLFVDGRDHHAATHANGQRAYLDPAAGGFRFSTNAGTPRGAVRCDGMTWRIEPVWYFGFDLARERERGLEAVEDHLCAAHGMIELAAGRSCTIELSGDDAQHARPATWASFAARDDSIAARWRTGEPPAAKAPAWIERLVLCSDQFIVSRDGGGAGTTVIAGYPWFTDWGRDTMIALPGLTLATGRTEIAKSILETFARYVDRGMIPNRFPDDGGAPEYNTADATLWYVLAAHEYWKKTDDDEFVRSLFPALAEIVDWHVRGTRYGIARDAKDGLLTSGEPGIGLTWMDARVGDRVVTARAGKAVEINALWINALAAAARFAQAAGMPHGRYEALAAEARAGFARFWNVDAGYCYDVLDGPSGDDASLRPNQLFAVSLPEPVLTPAQMRSVVHACARALLVSYGARSLAPSDPAYRGTYEGDPAARDGAYHQGTAWGWLLGPFALAHYRAYGDAAAAIEFLKPIEDAITEFGVGTLGELFDGDPPHRPRGCIAQAWSVAETLRAWSALAKELHA